MWRSDWNRLTPTLRRSIGAGLSHRRRGFHGDHVVSPHHCRHVHKGCSAGSAKNLDRIDLLPLSLDSSTCGSMDLVSGRLQPLGRTGCHPSNYCKLTGREERSGVTGAAQNGGLQYQTWPLGDHRPVLVGKRGLRVLFSTEGDTSRSEEVALQ